MNYNLLRLIALILALTVSTVAAYEGHVFASTPKIFNDSDYLNTGTQTFDIRLTIKPNGNVHVAISTEEWQSQYYAISPCTLVFTEDDWDKSQTITIRALPITLGAITEGSVTLDFQFILKYPHPEVQQRGTIDQTYCKQTVSKDVLRVTRILKKEKRCFSTGDPHFESFDEEKFDYYGENNGIYYLMKSPETTIIAQHYKCWGSPYCNKAIAVRHYDKVIQIRLDESQMSTNDVFKIMSTVEPSSSNIMKIEKENQGATIILTLSDSTTIQIDAFPRYINFYVTASGIYHSRLRASDLCGNFDGVKDDQLNLNWPQIPTQFTNTPPTVEAADNYFDCPDGGCALSTRSIIDKCTPTAIPADFCGTGPMPAQQKVADVVVEEEVYSSETLSASEGFTDVSISSTVSGSSSSRTSRGSYTRSRTSYVLPSSSSSVSSEPSTIADSITVNEPVAEALKHDSANPYAGSCFEMTPMPIFVRELSVDDTIESYCDSVFSSHPALGCVQHGAVIECKDAAIMGFIGIENVVSFAQDIMNSARLRCSLRLKSLLSGAFDSNRIEGERLSKVYDIEFTHINCTDGKVLPKVITLSNKIRTTLSASGTNTVVEDPCADGSCIIADSSNQTTAGLGVAAAFGGAAAVGLLVGLVIMNRRKLSSPPAGSIGKEPKVILRENPLYASAHGSNDSLAQTARGKVSSGPRRTSARAANRRISDIA